MNLKQIVQKAAELEQRVLSAGVANERDLAQAQELVSQYMDELERLENTATVRPYLSSDVVAEAVLKWWYQ